MNSKATVLIDEDGHARLTNFGLTSIISGKSLALSSRDHSLTNTTTWAAPEILKGGPVSEEGDIFTFAMVAAEVCAWGISGEIFISPAFEQTFLGHSPFGNSYLVAIFGIMTGKRPTRPESLRHDGLWKMMERCWNQDPRERPNSSQLLEFFRKS